MKPQKDRNLRSEGGEGDWIENCLPLKPRASRVYKEKSEQT